PGARRRPHYQRRCELTMRTRDETEGRPAMAGVLVVVPARDEEDEVAGSLRSIARAAAAVDLPVVVTVVLHRCADATAERVADVVRTHPDVHWTTTDSDAAARA